MAKRFITTDMFEDTWFMDLPNKYKLFWVFLITKCDHAGIWQVNFKVAQFYTGEHLEPVECERMFKDRIIKLDDGKYWFMPKFISFQYGHLNENVKAHKSVIDILEKKGLSQTVSKQLSNCSTTVKDKDKDKDKVIDKDKEYPLPIEIDSIKGLREKYIEWLEHRKESRLRKLTERGIKGQVDFLLKQPDPIGCIEQSIRNGYQGLFEIKGKKNDGLNQEQREQIRKAKQSYFEDED